MRIPLKQKGPRHITTVLKTDPEKLLFITEKSAFRAQNKGKFTLHTREVPTMLSDSCHS